MKLHDLRPTEGSTQKRKRVGRGTGSGKGKTSGRGTKGQNSRSGGGTRISYERGRNAPIQHIPKLRGFNNRFKVQYTPVNLDTLTERFAEGSDVSPEILQIEGIINNADEPIVILGRGDIDVPLHVKAHRISSSARQKIESAGGSVEVLPLATNKRLPRS